MNIARNSLMPASVLAAAVAAAHILEVYRSRALLAGALALVGVAAVAQLISATAALR